MTTWLVLGIVVVVVWWLVYFSGDRLLAREQRLDRKLRTDELKWRLDLMQTEARLLTEDMENPITEEEIQRNMPLFVRKGLMPARSEDRAWAIEGAIRNREQRIKVAAIRAVNVC